MAAAANQTGTLEAIGIEVAKVFLPLKERVEAGEIMLLLAELGMEFPASLANDAAFNAAVTSVTGKVEQLVGLSRALIAAIKAEDYALSAEKSVALVEAIAGMADDLQAIADAIAANGPYAGITDAQLGNFVADLAKNLIDYLVITYLQVNIQLFAVFLEFFGLLVEKEEPWKRYTNMAAPPV